jgi:hypothetical protein
MYTFDHDYSYCTLICDNAPLHGTATYWPTDPWVLEKGKIDLMFHPFMRSEYVRIVHAWLKSPTSY